MVERTQQSLAALYEQDETAWLETMARLIEQGKFDDLDYENLSEYLKDMSRRDRREMKSRLITLLAHLLKWDHQPEKRTRSWRSTIFVQRRELRDLLDSRTLRQHAEDILTDAFTEARKQAAVETGLLPAEFPPGCPWPLARLLEETDLDDKSSE